MSTALVTNSATEERIRNEIRDVVMREIERQQLTDDELARQLGMLPSGATMLRQRRVWALGEAIWIAEKLGVDVSVEVAPRGREK